MYTGNDNGYPERWDVLVIGAGNAGLCAAITAAEAGCSVLVLEAAPRDMRGGNTRHTRNLRAMHEEPTDVLTDAYSFEEYFEDLMRVTRGVTNKELAGEGVGGDTQVRSVVDMKTASTNAEASSPKRQNSEASVV